MRPSQFIALVTLALAGSGCAGIPGQRAALAPQQAYAQAPPQQAYAQQGYPQQTYPQQAYPQQATPQQSYAPEPYQRPANPQRPDLDSLIYAQAAYTQGIQAAPPPAAPAPVPSAVRSSGPSPFLANIFSRSRPAPAVTAAPAPAPMTVAPPPQTAVAVAAAPPAPVAAAPAAQPTGFIATFGRSLGRSQPAAAPPPPAPQPPPAAAMATAAPPIGVGPVAIPAPGEPPYTLDSGDRLRIVVFGQDGLSNSYFVDAAGNVTMPLIGPVAARGQTTQELAHIVAERLRRGFIREPHVAIEVEAYRPFFILGEVTYPGQYPYVPNMTIETAVAIAGGFSPRAYRSEVYLDRPAPGGLIRARSSVPLFTRVRPGDTLVIKERWF